MKTNKQTKYRYCNANGLVYKIIFYSNDSIELYYLDPFVSGDKCKWVFCTVAPSRLKQCWLEDLSYHLSPSTVRYFEKNGYVKSFLNPPIA